MVRRYRALRWLVPVAVVGVTSLGGLAATGTFTAPASSSASLPHTSPNALVAAMDSAKTTGFSGTIVARMSLGLPDLPALSDDRGHATMTSLLSGSHTVRIWYGGPQRQRLALLSATSESDLFRSGRDVWQWNSATRVAEHLRLRSPAAPAPAPSGALAASPGRLAERLLDAVDANTTVHVERGRTVADRSTYELRLTPQQHASRIGSVLIDIDGATKIPLAVRVYARGSTSPAIDVAFTSITFKMPAEGYFQFSPPPGATVHRATATDGPDAASAHRVWTSGTGWASVVGYQADKARLDELGAPLFRELPAVTGSWGSGRLLDSPLLCVLITDGGRVFAGSVDPPELYAAAAAAR